MEKIEKEWQENNETSSITDALYEYIRYWKWFILSIIICLAAGIFVILTTQREYKSSLSILLDEEKNASKSSANIDLESLGLLTTTSNIDNEIAILSSPDLMRQVVDTMNLQSTYYTKNLYRKTEIYFSSPFLAQVNNKNEKLFNKLSFSIQKISSGFEIEGLYLLKTGEEIQINQKADSIPVNIILPNNSGVLNIKQSGQEIKNNEKYYIEINNTPSTVQYLCSRLSIIPTSKSSSVLNLNLLVNNSERGSAILKELVRQYNEMNVRVNNEMAYNTALFINDRLKEIAIELGDVEREVVDYKQKNRIADLGSEAQMIVQQSGQNQQKMMEMETQLGVVSMIDKFVNDPNNQLKPIPNLGITDPALSQIITEYNSKLIDSDALLKSTGEENPMRMRITEEINNMRRSISSSLTNVKQAYSISKRDLSRLTGATISHIQSIPQQEKGLLEKVRQQQVKENLFLFLMQKREETNISIASTSDKARIISSPQIEIAPIAPKSRVILLASFIIGLLIPIVIIYAINLFRTQIRNRTQLEKLTNISVVGQINKNSTKSPLVVQKDQSSGISEMFRSLRNNLNFILKNKENPIILVTSTISNEGKTFICVNLAMTFALSHKKVLLIGADIRKPKLQGYFNIQDKKGLTDYLVESGNNNDWTQYVKKSEINENLDILISGTIPPNPNELLMSPKLKSLLFYAKKTYDIILIDSAPVGLVSDTYLISEFVDVSLYVVRENITP